MLRFPIIVGSSLVESVLLLEVCVAGCADLSLLVLSFWAGDACV